jgi:hypothetical protein
MMKRNTLLLIGAAAVVLYMYSRNRRRRQEPIPEAKDLTPEQRASVKQISDVMKGGGFRWR